MEILLRALQKPDIRNGFLEALAELKDLSAFMERPELAEALFDRLTPIGYNKTVVAEVDGKVVGTGTLFVKQKFSANGTIVGHIEDVAVKIDMQGKHIGSAIVTELLKIAHDNGCKYVMLVSSDTNMKFYERFGFEYINNTMFKDIP